MQRSIKKTTNCTMVYICEYCRKEFRWSRQLNDHLSIHTGQKFTCEECGSEQTTISNLNRHKRIFCKKQSKLNCDESNLASNAWLAGYNSCKSVSGTVQTKDAATNTHYSYVNFSMCYTCKRFMHKGILDEHLKIHAEKDKLRSIKKSNHKSYMEKKYNETTVCYMDDLNIF